MVGEANRFIFHGILLHVSNCIVTGNYDFFNEDIFKTITITAMAVILYHLLVRKVVEPPLKKMKIICRRPMKRSKQVKPKIDNSNGK
jgi:hypothetical protein